LAIVVIAITMIEKQKTMDRKAGRTNLVAANAGASMISAWLSKTHPFVKLKTGSLPRPA